MGIVMADEVPSEHLDRAARTMGYSLRPMGHSAPLKVDLVETSDGVLLAHVTRPDGLEVWSASRNTEQSIGTAAQFALFEDGMGLSGPVSTISAELALAGWYELERTIW